MSIINHYSTLFESEISKLLLPKGPSNLYEPIYYILEAGGKRIRPILVLAAASIFGADQKNSMKAALAIEIFHNFTLLHDDIMDNATVRRARPTVHKKWNENVAILSGDAMVIHSYKILSECKSDRFNEIFNAFNTLASLVCEGQQMDMDFESSDNVTIEEYKTMITLKTSALIAGALKIGAIIGGASIEVCEKFYQLGIDIGIAFQVEDDILDSYGNEALFGKRIGGDILEGKKTYLLITALNKANKEQKEHLLSTLKSGNISDSLKIETVKAIYDNLGVKEIAEQEVENYKNEAFKIIEELKIDEKGKDILSEIADRLIGRKK